MRLNKTVFLLLVFLLSPTYALDSFETDDIFAIKSVTLSDVSNDGNSLIYITTQADKKDDDFKDTLYLIDLKSGKKVVLLRSNGRKGFSFSSVKFSGDSKSIYFLSSGEKASGKNNTQLWSLNLSNRIKRRLTNFDGNISDYDISEDGSSIAFIGNMKSEDKDKSKTPSPVVIDRYQFKRDYEGFLGNDRDHLFIFDSKSRRAEQLTSGQRDHLHPSISPNGKSIAYMTKEGDFDRHNNWEIFIKDLKGDENPRKVMSKNGEDLSTQYPSKPEWSPDGKKIAYLHGGDHSMLWYALEEVSIIDVETGDIDFITREFDRNTRMPQWSKDGQSVFFILEDDMKSQLMKYSLQDNSSKKVTPENMYLTGYSRSYFAINNEVVFQSSTSSIPSEIYHLKEDQILSLIHI